MDFAHIFYKCYTITMPTPLSVTQINKTVREHFERVFALLQSEDNFVSTSKLETWAMQNPTEFYKLCSKLIPTDMRVSGAMTINVVTGVPPKKLDDIDHEEFC